MLKKEQLILSLAAILFIAVCSAQKAPNQTNPSKEVKASQPFLFSVTSLTPDTQKWSVEYLGSYSEKVSGPFGYNGLGQQFSIKGYLGNQFTLYANNSLGFPNDGGSVSSAQQAEIIRDVIGGKESSGFRLGIGLGGKRDYSAVAALFSRITTSIETSFWRLSGNVVFEKAFESNRDAIDLTTSIGFQYRIFNNFFAGFEALGEDLEGFWEEDEAEGGAKVLIGPSVNFTPNASRLTFSICGGPVVYATRSDVVPSEANRDLYLENGLTVKFNIIYSLSEI